MSHLHERLGTPTKIRPDCGLEGGKGATSSLHVFDGQLLGIAVVKETGIVRYNDERNFTVREFRYDLIQATLITSR